MTSPIVATQVEGDAVILQGVVERVTYEVEGTGFKIIKVTAPGYSRPVPILGEMNGVTEGQEIEAHGHWHNHSEYGWQIMAELVVPVIPSSAEGMRNYLASGFVKGIGPVKATRITDYFGDDTRRILDEEPGRLIEVSGISARLVAEVEAAWPSQRAFEQVKAFLFQYDISANLIGKIVRTYGQRSIQVMQENPYQVAADIRGVGFVIADSLARKLGMNRNAPERLMAGLLYLLDEASDEGHVYLPAEELLGAGLELMQNTTAPITADMVQAALSALIQYRKVYTETESLNLSVFVVHDPAAEHAVYKAAYGHTERAVARMLRDMTAQVIDRMGLPALAWESAVSAIEGYIHYSLTDRQREVVRTVFDNHLTVLTGGPGTGKTTTIRSVVALAEQLGFTVALASPTGRAAKRLSEATGGTAKTIHRLLEATMTDDGFAFKRGLGNPLDADLIVVDEFSMTDIFLLNHLLKAVPAGAHLLLVGDSDQLPSVGAGTVLHDLVFAIDQGLPGAAIIRLDTIFRQRASSFIIANAHNINRGYAPTAVGADDFFIFVDEDKDRAVAEIISLVSTRIPAKFGFDPSDIQVLAPQKNGVLGVEELNVGLQAILNPARPDEPEQVHGKRVFRVGDRVMQTRNDYEKDVLNGDMGAIVEINHEEKTVLINFDDREVEYSLPDLDDILHAYAITIHKSQGSQFPVVVVPVHTTNYQMLQRNLLYTAVTRAEKLVVLVVNKQGLKRAVYNNPVHDRYSGLAARLLAEESVVVSEISLF